MKAFMLAVCALALVVVGVQAQGIDGKWTGEVAGGRGPVPVTLTLKADGTKLTGSLAGGRGGEVTLTDGSISGSTIKFKTTQQGRGGEVTMDWTGTVKGDEISFSRKAEGGDAAAVEFTVKRAS